MVLLLMNPFREDAVVDVRFDADVGLDSLEAVVVPARRVLAIDVTTEVTVAARVQTSVEVISGRLVGHRLQVRNGASLRGLAVTPMIQRGSAVSVLPSVRSDFGVFDRIIVTNPSNDEVAEVDLEIVTDGSVTLDLVEPTVRSRPQPLRWQPSLDSRPRRIAGSALTGTPVAVGLERQVPFTSEIVPGTSAMPAVDSGARRWALPLDGTSP